MKKVLLSSNTENAGKNTIARLFKLYDNVLYYKQFPLENVHPQIQLAKFFNYCNTHNIEVALFKQYLHKPKFDFNVYIIRNMFVSNFVNKMQCITNKEDEHVLYKETPKNSCVIYHEILMTNPLLCLEKICEYIKIPFINAVVDDDRLKSYNKYLTIYEYNMLMKFSKKKLNEHYKDLQLSLKKYESLYMHINLDKILQNERILC